MPGPEDPEEHVAMMFHGLVTELQTNDVTRFEAEQKREREARAALRHSIPNQGMSAGELLKKIDGDPADDQKRIEAELARMTKEAQAAAAEKDKKNEPLPAGFFPPPPTSG
jgi:hypothetical protein